MAAETKNIGKDTAPYYLWHVHKKAFTGSMMVRTNDEKKHVYKFTFKDGQTVTGKSNNVEECLGRVLYKNGRISATNCQISIDKMKSEKRRQGEILAEMGLLTEDEIPELLKLQLKMRLHKLFELPSAKFTFKAEGITATPMLVEPMTNIIYWGGRQAHKSLSDELEDFKGMYLNKTSSFDSIFNELQFDTPPHTIVGRAVDDILMSSKEAIALAYTLILTGALRLAECSEDKVKLQRMLKSLDGKNHFEILGIGRAAKSTEVKQAYRKLAKLYHPDFFDRHSDGEVKENAHKILSTVGLAYKILNNKNDREVYEKRLNLGITDNSEEISKDRMEDIFLGEMEFKKGQSCIRFSNFLGALAAFTKAIELNPDDIECYAYKGWALFNKPGRVPEDVEEAKTLIEKTLSVNSNTLAMVHFFKGVITRVEGDMDGALKSQQRALHIDKNLIEAQNEIRFIEKKQAEGDKKGKGMLGSLFKR
jgi:tetratricopeptide (TPR) repeat protein